MTNTIFLPGLGSDGRLFKELLSNKYPQDKTRTIVCKHHNNMEQHIEYILNNSPSEFNLVGHSFGGWVAQWVAIKAPQRVNSLVLIGTSTGKLNDNLKDLFNDMLNKFKLNKAREFFDSVPLILI